MMIKKNYKLESTPKEESDLYRVDYQGCPHLYTRG